MECDCKDCPNLRKVQGIARRALDALPAKWNEGFRHGLRTGNIQWEEGWKYGKEQERLRNEENANFTEEIMKLEEEIERLTK